MHPKDANSVDPDQTAPLGADLGLHCLPRPVCPKTLERYGKPSIKYRFIQFDFPQVMCLIDCTVMPQASASVQCLTPG